MTKFDKTTAHDRVVMVTACNDPSVYARYVAKSVGIDAADFHRYDNSADNRPVPERYNQFIEAMPADLDAWIAFVHNDFQFLEDPRGWLSSVSPNHLYGVVGADIVEDEVPDSIRAGALSDTRAQRRVLRGQVECSTDLLASGVCGTKVDGMVPVRTVDCCCLIIHASLIRRLQLRFDASFPWHLYTEELSLRAARDWGVRTFVIPVRSGHYGRGAVDEMFHTGLKRLKETHGDILASTCHNPYAIERARSRTSRPAASEIPALDAAHAVQITVVVIVFRMARQAMRTLHSLSADYQRGIKAAQYEVLVYENPSDDMLSAEFVEGLPENFRYTRLESASASPVPALNRGIREARGRLIGAMIDGARIVTPGLLRRALFASRTHPRSVVTTLGWYLGCDAQGVALTHGHSAAYETELLKAAGWPRTPYRLFEVSTLDQSSADGWVARISESNAIFMSRAMWSLLGGFDEGFVSEGGGLANLDLLKRACETPNAQHVLLADEATFHQTHGGVSTNAAPDTKELKRKAWHDEYRRIRGANHAPAGQKSRVIYGALRAEVAAHLVSALVAPARSQLRQDDDTRPFFPMQDARLVRRMNIRPRAQPPPAAGAAVEAVRLVERLFNQNRFVEARDAARLVLRSIGHGKVPVLEQITALCANYPGIGGKAPPKQRSSHLASIGSVHRALGEMDLAERAFVEALRIDTGNDVARFELSAIRLPGASYLDRLSEVHEFLRPNIYLEIGVFQGDSISLARPPTQAFGVDPEPSLMKPCRAETRIHPWKSDYFFLQNERRRLIPRRVDFAFIDGLHQFMQVVRDFWNVERLCHPNSVIAFHDTLPLDRQSAARNRTTGYWTGDVWKIIPFLMSERTDLRIATVKAPPSGLTLVAGLRTHHFPTLEETLARAAAFDAADYDAFESTWRPRMTLLDNTRPALADWLLFGRVPA
jgi:hypothetical protein